MAIRLWNGSGSCQRESRRNGTWRPLPCRQLNVDSGALCVSTCVATEAEAALACVLPLATMLVCMRRRTPGGCGRTLTTRRLNPRPGASTRCRCAHRGDGLEGSAVQTWRRCLLVSSSCAAPAACLLAHAGVHWNLGDARNLVQLVHVGAQFAGSRKSLGKFNRQ